MSHPLKWEFPGGKIRPGECPEQCIAREILEELGVEIILLKTLPKVGYNYPGWQIALYPFVCNLKEGNEPKPLEHADLIWVHPLNATGMDWAGADLEVLKLYGQGNEIAFKKLF